MELRLELSCGACPEQYDAYLGPNLVGYLRLRHGYFSVCCPDAAGEEVYEAYTVGDGMFDPDERDFFITKAKAAIYDWCHERTER
jgi:hypothetical protein